MGARLARGVLVLLAAGTVAGGAQEQDLDFKGWALDYLERGGFDPEDASLHKVVDGSGFVGIVLGAFDVRFPADALADETLAQRFVDSVQTLVDIQRPWYEWRGTPGDRRQVDADWKTLSKWVKSWSARKLARLEGGGPSLFEQLGADDKVLEAADRLVAYTAYPEEIVSLMGDRNLTILAPTRKHFLELVAVAGLLNEKGRDELWKNDMIRMAAGWSDWDQIIALENFSHPLDWNAPFRGSSLNQYEKLGLVQHVADRASVILLRKEFYRHGTHFFEESLATNLVIATIGQNGVSNQEWEFSYYRAGASTQPYERFVPGGNPGGGVLPPRKAQAGPTIYSGSVGDVGKYRENLGVGFFRDPLKTGQKDGAKLAGKEKDHPLRKDKRAHFRLYSFETHTSSFVTAPFLGIPSEGKELPDHAFLDDYEDFFRAYRSGFLEWLRLHGDEDEERAAELFGELVRRHAEREEGVAIDTIAEEIYGIPLSSKDAEADSLEWRFLTWLQKGR